jgi:hypothetical protein
MTALRVALMGAVLSKQSRWAGHVIDTQLSGFDLAAPPLQTSEFNPLRDGMQQQKVSMTSDERRGDAVAEFNGISSGSWSH